MKKIILIIINVLLIAGLAVFGGLYFRKYQDLKNNPPAPDVVLQQQNNKTIAAVSKLYDLPKDEQPTITAIKDVSDTFKKELFFAKAQNGDITLVYTKAKLAIIYRPSTKQLVNVSSVTIQNNPVIKVYGPGRAAAEAKLTSAKLAVTDGGDASLTSSDVLIVDLSGKNAATAQSIAAVINGQVGNQPVGVTKPTGVDIAVYTP
ncbi:MAG: hypothetical protein NVS1B7_1340 [Candidatus Saccharimonadales bacterium]